MTTDAMTTLRALHAEQLGPIFASLTEDEWNADTPCEGWKVRDLVAHISSTFNDIANPADPPEPADAGDGAAEVTAEEGIEILVGERKGWSTADVLAEYQRSVGGALAALDAMQAEPIASAVIPLADLGDYETHLLANAFAFDHYCHLRFDLLAPNGPVERPLDDPTDAELRPGVEWMIAGLPKMQPGQFTSMSNTVVLELTGPGGGVWTIAPSAGGNVDLRDGDDATAVARITSTAHDFVSWGTIRSPWRDHVSIDGDETAAAAFLDTLNII